MPGLYYDPFHIGRRFQHAVHRTVTETDTPIFSTVSLNRAALHLKQAAT